MGNEEKTEHLASLDFEKVSKSDVAIDLKMKTTDTSSPLNSYPCKRTMFMPPSSQYPPLFSSGKDTSSTTFLGDDGVSGSIHVGSSDVCDAVSSGPAAALLSKPFNNCARASMALSEKAPFTASQLQELQRQTIICKYIMASMPVPPQLLLPLPNYPSPAHHPQSNRSGLDLKFSSGSDPEPWRCKRTDGKKWRCSRDVAPDQKYCERHAHKSKPRSRKPVEIHTTNNSNRHPSIVPPVASRNHQSFQFPTVQLSADQTRCIEWLGRGDRSGTTIPVINCNQQNLQQLMQSSPRMGFNNDHTDQNRRNTPAFQMQDESKVYPMNFNQYISNRSNGQIVESPLKNEEYSDSVIASLQGRTTRDFIDAWSKDGLNDGLSNNGSSTSLTLSMSGWNHGLDDDNEHAQVSIGTLDSERSSDEVLRSQWLNPVSWMTSTAPGGPLGEALCLGNASNLPSPHGYSNSTATSSCSFNSCENGSHGFDFIG